MRTNIIFSTVVAIMLMAMPAHAALLKGYVFINGDQTEAEYTKLSDSTVSVGSGKNACIPQYTAGHLTIPGEVTIGGTTYRVTEVGNVAFRLCDQITGVEIQQNVKRIGNFAFVGCSKLAEITLPASLESIGSGAFINTVTLQTAASVTCLGDTPPRWEYNDVFAFHSAGISDPNPAIVPASVEIFVPEGKTETYKATLFTNPDIGWTGADGWGAFSKFYTGISSVHIYNNVDLLAVRDIVNNHGKYNFYKSITLERDIDMHGAEWDWGIGNDETHPFEGSFNGNGHTISNLKINNANGPAGLFSYFGGKSVENVCLKNIDARGTEGVGAFAGASGHCTFSSVWVEDCSYAVSNGHIGGILGKCLTTGGAIFNQCVVASMRDIDISPAAGTERSGGIVGVNYGGSINDCAVVSDIANELVNPFVGNCSDGNTFYVNNSYATEPRFQQHTPAANIRYNEHVVLWGNTTFDVTSSAGTVTSETIDTDREYRSLMMIPALGLDHWAYQDNEFPLPVAFEDKLPVLVNQAVYRPMSSSSKRVNGLMLGSGTPWTVFLDNSDQGYRSKTYFSHRLWIDDHFPYNAHTPVATPYPVPYLPIGQATITCWNGVDYDRTLSVTSTGTKPVTVPKVKVGDDGKPMLDDMGDYITDGDTTLYEISTFQPTGYGVYLPYQLHHNNTFKLFEPENVTAQGNKAQLKVNEIEAETIYPWTPYYLVVTDTPVALGTSEEVTITPEPQNTAIAFGPGNQYKLCGNKNPFVAQDRMLVIAHLDDFRQAFGTIYSWRAYFTVPEGISVMNITRELRFYENLNNNIAIRDFDNNTVNATLRGRTFVKDGTWYTLCLPFDVSGDMGPLEGATICKLDGCTLDDGSLTIDFKQVNHIEAGVPYIVKWEPGASIENPCFEGVTIKDVNNQVVKAGHICMAGNYMPINVNENTHVLYLGDNNRLYRPDRDMTINAFRACFYYDNSDAMGQLHAIKLNVKPDDIVTAVDEVAAARVDDPNWYTVDGRVLPVKPTARGIYIHGGKKIIIR